MPNFPITLKPFITYLFFFCFSSTISNAQQFDWAKSISGLGLEVGNALCTDSEGNVILVSSFSGSAQIGNTVLSGMGGQDAFVAKFTANGDLLWARVITGPKEDVARGVITDDDDNIYVVGHFTDSVIFVLTQTEIVAASGDGKKDLFIAKYSPSGAFQWFVQGGGSGDDTATDIAWFKYDGKLVVSGGFEGRGTFGATILLSRGLSDALILKVDRQGAVQWARRGGGEAHDVAAAVAVNPGNGSIYVIGDYYVEAEFGGVQLNAVGSSDMYLAKYDRWGEFQWVRSNGGTAVDVATDVGTDFNDNVYVSGYYQGTTTFQNFTATAEGGYNDVFLSKFDADGNCQWLNSAGSYRLDNCMSMAVAWNGFTYLTGFFDELMVVNGDSIIGNGYDIFVLNYSSSGEYRYGKSAGAGSSDFGVATCLGPEQSLYIAGYYFFFADFDNITIGNATNGDGFIARMSNIVGIESAANDDLLKGCVTYNPSTKNVHVGCNLNGEWTLTNLLGQQLGSGTISSNFQLPEFGSQVALLSFQTQSGSVSLRVFSVD